MLFEKILVIDDDPRQLESVKLVLGKYYEVICFKDAREALAYLSKPHGVRLVLTDVCMQGMDGLMLLQEIKALGRNIAVIMMTGFSSRDVVLQALRGGADDFIDKPFDVRELKEKVRSLFQKKFGVPDEKSLISKRLRLFTAMNLAHVSLNDLAGDVCFSAQYVSRIFKKENDLSFREYKINLKIEKAKELLEKTTYPVFKISHILGYRNPETFMRIFKRKTSMTPLEFRERAAGDISA